MSQTQKEITDLELMTLVYKSLCHLRNQKLPFDEVKDTYSLCWIVEERLNKMKAEQPELSQ